MALNKNQLEQRATYATLTGVFIAFFTAFNLYSRRRGKRLNLRPLDLAMLGLSSYRLGRLIAYDKIIEPERAAFTKTVPDPTGAGDTVEPKGRGWRRAIGELIACPICAGTWIAAGLVYGLTLFPNPTRVFLAIMSSIGIGELLNAATEYLQWFGQAAREEAGEMEKEKRGRSRLRR